MASSDIPSRRKVNTIGGPPPGKGAEERGQSALAHLRCTKAAGEGPGRGTPFDLRARNTDSGFPKAPGPRLLRCQFSLQDVQAYLQWREHLDSESNILQIFQSCSSSIAQQYRCAVSPHSAQVDCCSTQVEVSPGARAMAGLARWVIIPSVVVYWWRRYRPDWVFLSNGPGSGSRRAAKPHVHVNKQLPNIFQGRLHHTPFRLPLFQSRQDNLSLNQVRSAARQALPESRIAHGILWVV